MSNLIKFSFEDPAFAGVILVADDALEEVVSALAEEKANDGTVTIKIKLTKCRFPDGYNKLRTGINVEYKVDSTVQTKTSAGNSIPTGQMMLCESETEGWQLITAPDPQQHINDYYD